MEQPTNMSLLLKDNCTYCMFPTMIILYNFYISDIMGGVFYIRNICYRNPNRCLWCYSSSLLAAIGNLLRTWEVQIGYDFSMNTDEHTWLIEAEWRIYARVSYAIIGSVNSLSPGRLPANTWTNAGIRVIGPLGANLSEICIEILHFNQENVFENNSVWKVTAILSRP